MSSAAEAHYITGKMIFIKFAAEKLLTKGPDNKFVTSEFSNEKATFYMCYGSSGEQHPMQAVTVDIITKFFVVDFPPAKLTHSLLPPPSICE
jgi:hypothetical protein